MKRLLLLGMLVCMCGNAHGFGLAASIGQGFGVTDGDVVRTPFNLEIIPSYSLHFIKFDLGLLTDLDEQVDFKLRPGVRIYPPFLYFRLAAPLRLTHGFDYGVLIGIGKDLISFGIASLFLEIDVYFTKDLGWDRVVPIDFRVGVDFSF